MEHAAPALAHVSKRMMLPVRAAAGKFPALSAAAAGQIAIRKADGVLVRLLDLGQILGELEADVFRPRALLRGRHGERLRRLHHGAARQADRACQIAGTAACPDTDIIIPRVQHERVRAFAVDRKLGDGEAQRNCLALAGGQQAALPEAVQKADGPRQVALGPRHIDLYKLAGRKFLSGVDQLGAHRHVAAVKPCRDTAERDRSVAQTVTERIAHGNAEGIKIAVAGKLVCCGAGVRKRLRALGPAEGKMAGRHDLRRQHVGQRPARLLPGKAEEDDRAAGERGLVQLDKSRRRQHEHRPVEHRRDARQHSRLLVGQLEAIALRRPADDDDSRRAVVAQSAEIEIRQRHFAALRVLYGPGAVFAGQKRIGPDRLACRKAVQHADGAPRRHGFVKGGGLQLFDAEHGDGQRCAILLRQQRERPVLVLQQHNPGSGSSARSQRVVAHSECDIHMCSPILLSKYVEPVLTGGNAISVGAGNSCKQSGLDRLCWPAGSSAFSEILRRIQICLHTWL